METRLVFVLCGAAWALGCSGAVTGLGDDAGSDAAVADAVPDGTGSDGGCGACLTVSVSWHLDGGDGANTEQSSLSACRTFTDTRTTGGGAMTRCTSELAPCGADRLGVGDVERVLANPDVVAALAAPPGLYGIDPRPYDGVILVLSIGSQTLQIGDACPATMPASTCRPIAPGLQAAVDFFRQLATQELATASCTTASP